MSAALDVLFLTAAGPGVGLGHLKRCEALGSALESRGATTRFAVAGLAEPVEALSPVARHALGLPWTRVPDLALDEVRRLRPHAVVVDAYEATTETMASLRAVGIYLVVIDDLADRELPADLIVNGTYRAEQLVYRTRPGARLLLGTRYTLLHPDFADTPLRRVRRLVERVLVTLGGDAGGERLSEIVEAAGRGTSEASIDVVVGPFGNGADIAGEQVRVHRGLPSLRPLLLEADLAVTASGITLYECMAAGTPAVALVAAENQRPNFEELGQAHMVVPGQPDLTQAVARLAGDTALRETLSAKGRAAVDGQGASRVASELMEAAAAASQGSAARGAR